jgi:hypothetical protein
MPAIYQWPEDCVFADMHHFKKISSQRYAAQAPMVRVCLVTQLRVTTLFRVTAFRPMCGRDADKAPH